MRKVRKTQRNNVDETMRKLAYAFLRDTEDVYPDFLIAEPFRAALLAGTVEDIRNTTPTLDYGWPPDLFKRVYQLQSMLKRYRFCEGDMYSDKELEEKAIASFHETQCRVAAVEWGALPSKTQRVLRLAAAYIARVLGPYSDEQHRALCRFGRRASVGIPARNACEAARWELPISGSLDQIHWFESEMIQVACVREYWAEQLRDDPNRSLFSEVSSLNLVLVPKSYKSLRAIMPNTTIGSYMSYGLGEMIRLRLKSEGYDIRHLQMKHRVLAQQASVTNLLTTADLSSASDSISVALVDLLLPDDWKRVLHRSRIGQVKLPDGSSVATHTFATMGIGYTFPLQTLIFLALLHGIDPMPSSRRRAENHISAYGDDLIYPSYMHHSVIEVFESIGFKLNVDKTFAEGPFRESCGGDYFRGLDVRPFQPQNGHCAYPTNREYEAILYKFINTLLVRWARYEVPRALRLLFGEIERVAGCCKLVPPSFTDESGIKCSLHDMSWFSAHALCSKPKSLGHGVYRFSYLALRPETREERRHAPYLWDRLRGGPEPVIDYSGQDSYVDDRRPVVKRIESLCRVDIPTATFICQNTRLHLTVRTKSGRRLRRTETRLTISHTGFYQIQKGFSTFQEP